MARRNNRGHTERDMRLIAAMAHQSFDASEGHDDGELDTKNVKPPLEHRPTLRVLLDEAFAIIGRGDGSVRGAVLDALALRAKAGDKEAIAEIVPAISPLLASIVHRQTWGDEAWRFVDDLFQDAWVDAIRACERYDGRVAFATFVFATVYPLFYLNLHTHNIKAGIRLPKYVCSLDPEKRAALELPAYSAAESEDRVTAEPPHVEAEKREETCLVRERVDRLPHKQRRVLTLRYGIGGAQPKSLHEVSGIMGLDRVAVRKIEAEALRELGAGR